MFELKILTDLTAMPKVVETNIDEVTPVIEAAIAKTKGLEVTDNKDEIVAADADAAKLRKMSDAIKRFRLDHIALWKEPMEAFETKCKAAEKKLTEAATAITAKTGEVKELWRQRKRDKYAKLWDEKLAEAFGQGSEVASCKSAKDFYALWTDAKTKGTWVNSSVSESSVVAAMDAEIKRMQDTLAAFDTNYADRPVEVRARAMNALLARFDMNDVIQAVANWEREQAEVAARAEAERKRQAEKDAAMEAQKKALAAKREQAGQVAPATVAASPAAPAPSAQAAEAAKETYRLEVTGTREALMKMKEYGLALGIAFKNLDNE